MIRERCFYRNFNFICFEFEEKEEIDSGSMTTQGNREEKKKKKGEWVLGGDQV